MNAADDNLLEQRSPVEVGVWIFILADMCVFAMYFGVFAWDKHLHPEQFVQGQATLNNGFGALNTIVLLISSYFMASAVHAARAQKIEVYARLIRLTIVCGSAFLVVKTAEYTEKISAGFHIASNEFYRNYFSFTGFHMVHVIVGLSFVTYLLFSIRTSEQVRANASFIEGVGLYWHMVDLLWVVLFSLIYLVP
ncbi:MAG: cytochrome c oxidase subunit 3 [Acidimicrobiales bacterium]|jgi:nitric oxide reductase NorE protein|nr:cytochrome c oxidase subunit 3 [Acidimicrobiales bacterium]